MKLNNILLIAILFFSQCIKKRLNPYDAGNPQAWTSINLDVTKYRNGDEIPQVQDASWGYLTTGAWCYYENNSANGAKYGKLYNWYAVNDPRGLAPAGYRIPSNEDWTILIENLGGKIVYESIDSKAGTKMKSKNGWDNDGNGTNSSGFNGLPGGYRDFNGDFGNVGANGYWWNSSDIYYQRLSYGDGSYDGFNEVRLAYGEQNGFSVRCIRD